MAIVEVVVTEDMTGDIVEVLDMAEEVMEVTQDMATVVKVVATEEEAMGVVEDHTEVVVVVAPSVDARVGPVSPLAQLHFHT